jgi:hypothetical protein
MKLFGGSCASRDSKRGHIYEVGMMVRQFSVLGV